MPQEKCGQKVFDMTLRQLADDYLKDQSTRIREGMVGKGSIGITEGRYGSIKTQVNRHLCSFLKENTKLSTIRPDMFKNKYTRFRRKTNPGVTEEKQASQNPSRQGNLLPSLQIFCGEQLLLVQRAPHQHVLEGVVDGRRGKPGQTAETER